MPATISLFFFNDPPTTELSPLSLHDALPICLCPAGHRHLHLRPPAPAARAGRGPSRARRRPAQRSEEQRLNSSHPSISYAVFCLKKKTTRRVAETARRGDSVRKGRKAAVLRY